MLLSLVMHWEWVWTVTRPKRCLWPTEVTLLRWILLLKMDVLEMCPKVGLFYKYFILLIVNVNIS